MELKLGLDNKAAEEFGIRHVKPCGGGAGIDAIVGAGAANTLALEVPECRVIPDPGIIPCVYGAADDDPLLPQIVRVKRPVTICCRDGRPADFVENVIGLNRGKIR